LVVSNLFHRFAPDNYSVNLLLYYTPFWGENLQLAKTT